MRTLVRPGRAAVSILACIGTIVVVLPTCAAGDVGSPKMSALTVDVVEFYNADQDHYFVSSLQPDIDALDSHKFAGWARTGLTFKAFPQAAANASPVCRFYIPPGYGDSHFFSASPTECAQTAAKFPWLVLETGNAMYMDLPNTITGACPPGDTPVYRVWDNRSDSNHRYVTSLGLRAQMVAKGWIAEGYGPDAVIMCAPPRSASATLLRSADGTTVYDMANNVTWLANANLPATNRFGLPLCGPASDTKACINASGSMSYQAAAAWVSAMNAANYLGHSNWQLPVSPSPDPTCPFTGPHGEPFGFGCTGSALGSLYANGLGLAPPSTAVPLAENAVGPFIDFQPYLYWSQSSDPSSGSGNYTFSFNSGFKGSNTAPNHLYVLPMIRGKLPGTPAAVGNGLQVDPGGQTIYDPVANVTWLANANLAATNTFGLATCKSPGTPKPCVSQDGAMNADAAAQFIANMNSAGYLGQRDWELPSIDGNCANYDCNEIGNPMGELYYGQFALGRGTPVVTVPNLDVGPFNDVQPYLYWSCLGASIQGACAASPPVPGFQFSFSFGNGFQGTDIFQNDLYVTAYFVGR